MATVVFENARISNNAPPLTLEEIFRLYGAWSGIHNAQFDALYSNASLVITGVEASDWDIQWLSGTFPANTVVNYYKEDLIQGVAFRVDGVVYLVTTDDANQAAIYQDGTLVHHVPRDVPATGEVSIVFRQQRLSDDEADGWHSITLYINHAVMASYSYYAGNSFGALEVGFAAYDLDTVTYTNVRIPELCEVAEYGTLDPGETPVGGLSRTIEGRYLRWLIRYDGSLRAWKTKAIPSAHEFTDQFAFTTSTDITELATHVRMMGAYIWVEAINNTLMRRYGQRFREVNNPMLLTEQEIGVEALRTLKRFEEQTFTADMDAIFVPMLEPEDHITANGEWMISAISLDINMGVIGQKFSLRRYVWE